MQETAKLGGKRFGSLAIAGSVCFASLFVGKRLSGTLWQIYGVNKLNLILACSHDCYTLITLMIEDIQDYNRLGGLKKQQSDIAMQI
ncbi:MAG: hypothetical protein WAM42_11475 [Candidatus Nitrosopolaris sp.]|jgi:hypothetical protein